MLSVTVGQKSHPMYVLLEAACSQVTGSTPLGPGPPSGLPPSMAIISPPEPPAPGPVSELPPPVPVVKVLGLPPAAQAPIAIAAAVPASVSVTTPRCFPVLIAALSRRGCPLYRLPRRAGRRGADRARRRLRAAPPPIPALPGLPWPPGSRARGASPRSVWPAPADRRAGTPRHAAPPR